MDHHLFLSIFHKLNPLSLMVFPIFPEVFMVEFLNFWGFTGFTPEIPEVFLRKTRFSSEKPGFPQKNHHPLGVFRWGYRSGPSGPAARGSASWAPRSGPGRSSERAPGGWVLAWLWRRWGWDGMGADGGWGGWENGGFNGKTIGKP